MYWKTCKNDSKMTKNDSKMTENGHFHSTLKKVCISLSNHTSYLIWPDLRPEYQRESQIISKNILSIKLFAQAY